MPALWGKWRSLLQPPPRLLLYDAFDGVDATALTSHTPNVGNPWTAGETAFEIRSGRCRSLSNNASATAWSDIGRSDFDMSAIVNVGGAGNTAADGGVGLLGRVVDINNYWILYVNSQVQEIALYTRIASVFTRIAGTPAVVALAADYKLHLSMFDTNIVGTLDDGYVATVVQANSATFLTATAVGMYGDGTSGDTWDDMRAYARR